MTRRSESSTPAKRRRWRPIGTILIHLLSPRASLVFADPFRNLMYFRSRGRRFARGTRRVGPGSFTPSPSQNSGLEPLDSSGSCHPMRAAALRQNRRAPPVTSWPIMVSTWIACPLRSTDITPLQRYYRAVRPSASHPYCRPRGSIHLWLLRYHRCRGLMFHTTASSRFRPPVCRMPLRP